MKKIEYCHKRLFFILLICSFALTGKIEAEILTVPEQYLTIQSAIDASTTWDTVLIEEGEYFEDVIISGHCITLASEFILDDDTSHISATIIHSPEANYQHRAITIENIPNGRVKVIGLSITGGNCRPGDDCRAGGLYAVNTDITLKYNYFYDNIARYGGGAFLDTCNTDVQHNSFSNNQAYWNGGGLFLTDGIHSVTNNNFSENSIIILDGTGTGGGLTIWSTASRGIIASNTFSQNTAPYGGGAIVLVTDNNSHYNDAWFIEDNLFFQNISWWGGAINSSSMDHLQISKNLFQENSAERDTDDDSRAMGGVMFLNPDERENKRTSIFENIFLANRAEGSGGVFFLFNDATIHDNVFLGNQGSSVNVLTAQGWPRDTTRILCTNN